MRSNHFRYLGAAGLLVMLLAFGSCGDQETAPGATGPNFELQVAPLTLAGIENICYSVAVYNADPGAGPFDPAVNAATVWFQDAICSDQYGNGSGGDISYVGPCDASVEGGVNYIHASIADVFVVDGPDGDTDPDLLATTEWENPCPAEAPCLFEAICLENQDVFVPINLAIMRDADQGFFDIAVNFEDIFCSAKFDCLENDFLHHPETGDRGPTAILGFACSAGPGQDTVLNMNDLVIQCDGEAPMVVSPGGGPGNYYSLGNLSPWPLLYQVAGSMGDEAFPASNPPLNKCYWNMALGINPPDANFTGRNCRLTTTATATDGTLMETSGLTPPGSVWPYVSFDIGITDEDGNFACGTHPLGTPEVEAGYTSTDGAEFCHYMDCQPDGGGLETGSYCEPTVLAGCQTPADLDGASNVLWFIPARDNGGNTLVGVQEEIDAIAAANGWTVTYWYYGSNPASFDFDTFDALVIGSGQLGWDTDYQFQSNLFAPLRDPITNQAIAAQRGSRTVLTAHDFDHSIDWATPPDEQRLMVANMVNYVIAGDGLGIVLASPSDTGIVGTAPDGTYPNLVDEPAFFLFDELQSAVSGTSFWINDGATGELYSYPDGFGGFGIDLDPWASHPVNAGLTSAGIASGAVAHGAWDGAIVGETDYEPIQQTVIAPWDTSPPGPVYTALTRDLCVEPRPASPPDLSAPVRWQGTAELTSFNDFFCDTDCATFRDGLQATLGDVWTFEVGWDQARYTSLLSDGEDYYYVFEDFVPTDWMLGVDFGGGRSIVSDSSQVGSINPNILGGWSEVLKSSVGPSEEVYHYTSQLAYTGLTAPPALGQSYCELHLHNPNGGLLPSAGDLPQTLELASIEIADLRCVFYFAGFDSLTLTSSIVSMTQIVP